MRIQRIPVSVGSIATTSSLIDAVRKITSFINSVSLSNIRSVLFSNNSNSWLTEDKNFLGNFSKNKNTEKKI